MLLFYGLGQVEELEPGMQLVRDVVNLVNRHVLRDPVLSADPPIRVKAATPNWLVAGTQHTCAGPAGAPAAANQRASNYTFTHTRADTSGIVVAILDTSPSQQDVEVATSRQSFQNNRLLAQVAARVSIEGPLSFTSDAFRHLVDMTLDWQGFQNDRRFARDHFRMPDHGLFAAGIVQDLASQAEIHLIRVLNDFGVGDLLGLTMVLSQLPSELLTQPDQRLIVNLSLVADIPFSERLLDLWFPETAGDLAALRDGWSDICRVFDLVQRSLDVVVSFVQRSNPRVLIVAAAGNDSDSRFRTETPARSSGRKEPRLPAAYDTVFGVAAVVRSGAAARYSNRGDMDVMGNGIATIGGELVANANGVPVASPTESITGIFISDPFPFGGGPNQTGWAHWSGTSFAAPIISGLAANVWAANPRLDSAGVIRAVRTLSTSWSTDLAAPVIDMTQTVTP
jgi:hypothetical protein